jgi:hypothetical protein
MGSPAAFIRAVSTAARRDRQREYQTGAATAGPDGPGGSPAGDESQGCRVSGACQVPSVLMPARRRYTARCRVHKGQGHEKQGVGCSHGRAAEHGDRSHVCGPVVCRDDPAQSGQNCNFPRCRRGEYAR